jgi:hypothetical protein
LPSSQASPPSTSPSPQTGSIAELPALLPVLAPEPVSTVVVEALSPVVAESVVASVVVLVVAEAVESSPHPGGRSSASKTMPGALTVTSLPQRGLWVPVVLLRAREVLVCSSTCAESDLLGRHA